MSTSDAHRALVMRVLGSGRAGGGVALPKEVGGGATSSGSSGSSASSATDTKLGGRCPGASGKTKVGGPRKGVRGTGPGRWRGAESRDVVLVKGGRGERGVGDGGRGVSGVLAVGGSISHATKSKASKVGGGVRKKGSDDVPSGPDIPGPTQSQGSTRGQGSSVHAEVGREGVGVLQRGADMRGGGGPGGDT
jgi:hypothetical protein